MRTPKFVTWSCKRILIAAITSIALVADSSSAQGTSNAVPIPSLDAYVKNHGVHLIESRRPSMNTPYSSLAPIPMRSPQDWSR